MSASSKKKLRKEQESAMLTEKQQQEQKERKKLKGYTIAFVALIAVIACVAIFSLVSGVVNRSGILQKNTVAATVGDHELNTVEFSYYYTDVINSTFSQWNSSSNNNLELYAQLMGLDLSKPYDKQVYNQETGETWADYFLNAALSNAASDYALADKANAEGHTLTEGEQTALENQIQTQSFYAQIYGYDSLDKYLAAVYGYGADEASYRAFATNNALAASYYTAHQDSLTYEDADLRAYEKDHALDFNSYSYHAYAVYLSNYEDKDKAAELAEADAKKLAEATSVEELDKAIAALENKEENVTSTAYENVLYTNVSTYAQEWLSDPDRQEGDITYLPMETTSKDEDGNETTTLNGYYVVRFESSTENKEPLANVRHILVKFEGGTTENGETVYSDEEKATAKQEAEKLLQEWKDGEATEESFAQLAKENTDDTSSKENGGLIEDIYPGANYVKNFLNWSIDPERKAGDTGIVESEYGYHVMYYVGDDKMTYRDYMIENTLRADDMEEWYTEIVEAMPKSLKNTSRLNMEYNG